ncbi:MAG: amidohydrolase family protein [Verrucomicrobia bacterium]|nr:amidohydrolase family protein [Verrucomicrobiota bacterium]
MKTLSLFDANGRFGCTAFSLPEFPHAGDLLSHMDRLGVSRSLVWHTTARDHHPNTGNRKLIEEIGSTPGAQDRLMPAYVIAPCMLHERGGMDALSNAMESGRVRALRLFPATLRHQLNRVDPILEKIALFKPVLFFDLRDLPQPDAILGLAERFPQLPIVLMQGMWGNMVDVLDFMRRRDNILSDISWLHINGTIELICREFGPRRLLFGLGSKAHQGASIAALANADIDDASRDLIAHANLERLLGLPANPQTGARAGMSAPKTRRGTLAQDHSKRLWNSLLNGRALDVEIVDAHAHLGPSGIWMMENQEIRDQAPQAIRDMDRCGIKTLIVSGMDALFSDPVEGNRLLEKSLRSYGNRFRGWLVFNPIYQQHLTPHLDSFFSHNFFVGFKLLNDYWRTPVTNSRLDMVWKYADQHRMPILLHTWEGPYDSPSMLKPIVAAHPHAVFILGHSGGGDAGRQEAEALAMAHSNVYLEWCGSFTSSIPWEETLRRVGPQRVVFGTDGVAHSFFWELGRLLSLDVPDATLTPILGDNMRAILARSQKGHALK